MEKELQTLDSGLTIYDMNKQLLNNERTLDPIELNLKIHDIRMSYYYNMPNYLMLLCHDRRDYTIFDFRTAEDDTCFSTFEGDLRCCLLNRGKVLTITPTDGEAGQAWEIWVRDEAGENFCYYLFNYNSGVIYY